MTFISALSKVAITILASVSTIVVNSKNLNKETRLISNYYYNQLITEDSKNIYRALNDMLLQDKFKTGTYTIDLISEGYLENRLYNQNKLMSDFIAARDTFRFDNPGIFYVDFSKISIRQLQKGDTYRINLGIGREDNYFYDGFNNQNVENAIKEVDNKIDSIIEKAKDKNTSLEKLEVIYQEIMSSSTYTLETTAAEENKLFVRTPYGTLVKGEALCEGFAKTTKMILDRMNYESILVQGMFNYENKGELHMWNYIKMEDSRYYLLDTTMDNGLNEDGTSRSYFLKSGKDEVSTEYIPSGAISSTSDDTVFELIYPSLSNENYSNKNSYFTFKNENGLSFASYLGMGIKESMKKGKYIVYTHNVNDSNPRWYYFAQSYAITALSMGLKPQLSDIDYKDKFDYSSLGNYETVFAVTDTKPQKSFEEIVANKNPSPKDAVYLGSLDDLYHYSNLTGSESAGKSKPYAIRKTPNTYLEENKTYEVSLKYNENLKKIYPNEPINIKGNSLIGETTVSNVSWNEKTPDTINFTFTTGTSFHHNLTYYFTLENLIGESSKQVPLETGLSVINKMEFACPQVEGAINTVYTNKPALISDGDLSSNGWTDTDGNKFSEDLPFRLALVASKPSDSKSKDMIEQIKQTNQEILSSSTYELSLQLCGAQVAFLNGNKLKVLMPFPEGYNAKDKGVTFKAYHFKQDGTPELIESTITEHGIIMFVDAFSPFAITAIKGETKTRDLVVQINGKAKVNDNFIKLKEGSEYTLNIELKGENVVDSIILNGKHVKIENNSLNIKYEDLNEYGNVLEINTLIKEIYDNELSEGFHQNEAETNKPRQENTALMITISLITGLAIVAGATTIFFIINKKKKKNN